MLTHRMMVQAIANRIAGLEVTVKSRQLTGPWRACFEALRDVRIADSSSTMRVLLAALEEYSDKDDILREIMAAQPGAGISFPSLADIAEGLMPIQFIWDDWLPRGMLTVFGASQGAGKSFVGVDLCYRQINQGTWPDGTPVKNPGRPVIYVDAEAVPQILNERTLNYGVDRKKLYLMYPDTGEMIDFGASVWQERLIEMVAAVRPEFVIVDSLSAINSRGQNNVEDVRGLLGFLTQLAAYYQIGVLLIHHIRKPSSGTQMLLFDLSLEDLSGSGHITAMARVVWGLHIIQTHESADLNGPRELKMLKTNLGPYANPLGFEFQPLHPSGVRLSWLENAPKSYKPPTCVDWLAELLEDMGEPIRPVDVVEMGEQSGYSRASVYRARTSLGDKIQDTAESKHDPNNMWEWVG